MIFENWPLGGPDGKASEEMAVSFAGDTGAVVLVLPAWFDEANKLRRFTLSVMRALAERGIGSALPDLPGCNESVAPLAVQTLEGWREAAASAADRAAATHVLAMRAGVLIAPQRLPGWHFAPTTGGKQLSAMLRAHVFAEREAGRHVTRESLLERGREDGLVLGGWTLGSAMVRALETAQPEANPQQTPIEQSELGGPGLWLRAEPSHDEAQARMLAAKIAEALNGSDPA
jgi:hypothetical protein